MVELPNSGANSFFGDNAGAATTGARNTFLGSYAGHSNITGNFNTYIGRSAGHLSTGTANVFLGKDSGYNATGSYNVFIGTKSGFFENGSHKLYIENSFSSSPLIYGEFDNDLRHVSTEILNINNGFSFPLGDGSAGQVLRTNGTGSLSWTDDTGPDAHPGCRQRHQNTGRRKQ